jgi:hypothetical protein
LFRADGYIIKPYRYFNLLLNHERSLNLGSGRDQWRVLGPIDLNDVDNLSWGDGGLAEELELSIRGGLPSPPPAGIQQVGIRIGWVRLEESADE